MKKLLTIAILLLIGGITMSFIKDSSPNYVDISVDRMCNVHTGDTLVIYYLYGKLYIRPVFQHEEIVNTNYLFIVK